MPSRPSAVPEPARSWLQERGGRRRSVERDHTNSWGFMDYEILWREIAATTNNLPNADVLAYSDTLGSGQKLSL